MKSRYGVVWNEHPGDRWSHPKLSLLCIVKKLVKLATQYVQSFSRSHAKPVRLTSAEIHCGIKHGLSAPATRHFPNVS